MGEGTRERRREGGKEGRGKEGGKNLRDGRKESVAGMSAGKHSTLRRAVRMCELS